MRAWLRKERLFLLTVFLWTFIPDALGVGHDFPWWRWGAMWVLLIIGAEMYARYRHREWAAK